MIARWASVALPAIIASLASRYAATSPMFIAGNLFASAPGVSGSLMSGERGGALPFRTAKAPGVSGSLIDAGDMSKTLAPCGEFMGE